MADFAAGRLSADHLTGVIDAIAVGNRAAA
jgi:hypothetical protein